MQTATEASSVASKLSRIARFDPVKLLQKLVQKCSIQSPESGNSCFNWLGLSIESAFLAGPLDSAPIPSPPSPPPMSPASPPPSPITTINNLSSRRRAHRNRLQPSRTHATQATADEPINPIDNLISRCRALRSRLQTPRTQATQATAAEPTTSTVSTFSSLRALRNRFQQARTQLNTNSTDTRRFFPGRNSPS
jgi:hypothetical protein